MKLKEDKADYERVRRLRGGVMRKMVVESTMALEDLKQTKQSGEKILLLGEFCRKLETEEEKVRRDLIMTVFFSKKVVIDVSH